MSEQSTDHATFTIERTYPASPARVFEAWADPVAKAQWFGPGNLSKEDHKLDFRVQGREHLRVGTPGGEIYTFDAVYQDILAQQRIIYSYDMHRGETRISVSLATVVFEPAGDGTRLSFTEQAVFLDGADTPAEREHGTRELLKKLETVLLSEITND